ncbi:TPA: DNA-binding protein, partial [Escherichia coli]|nr:DNA-binding protein [Escherichia coli]
EPLDDAIPKEEPELLNKLLLLLDKHSIIKVTELTDIFALPLNELSAITRFKESDMIHSDNVISFTIKQK